MITVEHPPVSTEARAAIRCTGIRTKGRFKGESCGELLARPRIEFFEIDMSSELPQVCPRCGDKYTLAKYLDMR